MTDNWDIERPPAATQRAYLCPVCSGPVNVVDKFCRHCGARFDEPEPDELSDQEAIVAPIEPPSLMPLILTAGGAIGLVVLSFAPQWVLSGPQAGLFPARPGSRGDFTFSAQRWWWGLLIVWVPSATAIALALWGTVRREKRAMLGTLLLGVAGLLSFERAIQTLARFASAPNGGLIQRPSIAAYAGVAAASVLCVAAFLLMRSETVPPQEELIVEDEPEPAEE